jgi:radical SAM-linked protein
MLGDKLRFRFAKTGTLRLLSHHDLMRCVERMLRRAALPFKSTAGFHPGPRVVFALSLPLGVAGLDEVVEIEFLKELDADETLLALRDQAPTGLTFTRVSIVPMKATAVPRRMVYTLQLPPERIETVRNRCDELLAEPRVWVERLKPSPKRLNIRPYLRSLSVPTSDRTVAGRLELDLWVTGTGTARADELVKLLNVSDLIEGGSVIERSTVELRDEVASSDPSDSPPDGPADTLPLDPATVVAANQKEEDQLVSALGPVVE